MVKVTFTVDAGTVRTLKATAERLNKPQSLVIREAVAEYAARSERLSETERRRLLRAVDEIASTPAAGTRAEAAREVDAIRSARRRGGRRHRLE